MPLSSDNDSSHARDGDNHDADSMVVPAMPHAHSQLLSGDNASSEALKGDDHTRKELSWCRRKISIETKQWLLNSLGEDVSTLAMPGLVRVPSSSSLDSEESSTGTASFDDDIDKPSKARGVSFAPTVTVQPIPHSSELSPSQRGRMFAKSSEVRRNKARNKREFFYDGCDWRNATEERDMDVCPMTGEEVHPVHQLDGRFA